MKPDTKLLLKRNNVWHINARCPIKLGGGLFRFSLHTSDLQQARFIRDRYVRLIRDVDTIEAALQMVREKLLDNRSRVKALRKELRLKK